MGTTLRCTDEAIGNLLPQFEMRMLPDADAERFETHLLECAHCMCEFREFSSVAGVMYDERAALARELDAQGISFAVLKRDLLRDAGTSPSRKADAVRTLPEILFGWARRPLVWAPALGVVALIFVTTLFLPGGGSKFSPLLSHTMLQFASPMPRGGGEAEREFGLARDAYNRKSYPEAITHFTQTVELDPQNGDAWLYLGVSQYLRKDAAAISSLLRAESVVGGDAERLAHTRWYLAQAYLEAGDAEHGILRLDQVLTQGGAHAQEAEVLKARVLGVK
jgi:tetratricopeptide (TPR) repeat protein